MAHPFDPGYCGRAVPDAVRRVPRGGCLPIRPVPPRVGPDLPSRPPRRFGACARHRPGSRAARNHRAPHSGRRSGPPRPGLAGQARRHPKLRVHQHATCTASTAASRPRRGATPSSSTTETAGSKRCSAAARSKPSSRSDRLPTKPGGSGSRIGRATVERRLRRGDRIPRSRKAPPKGTRPSWPLRRRSCCRTGTRPCRPWRRACSTRTWLCHSSSMATNWADGDRVPIPEFDFPAGLPAWMHEQDGWAKRAGTDDLAKRRNITLTVPKGVVA